jgi:hypothetical protein
LVLPFFDPFSFPVWRDYAYCRGAGDPVNPAKAMQRPAFGLDFSNWYDKLTACENMLST